MSEKGHAMALRMPSGTLEFIKNNEMIAQIVGSTVGYVMEKGYPKDVIGKVLPTTAVMDALREVQVYGTEEDLQKFIACVIESTKDPIDMGHLTYEEVIEVAEKMGADKFTFTAIPSVVDTPVS